jgi:hypothetical protein
MGNYSIGNLFTKEPAAIAGAFRAVLYVLVLAGVLVWDAALLAGVALALEVVLTLFVRQVSTPTAAPTLPVGTLVANPAAPNGDTPPPDLIVARTVDVNPQT